jgi:hypothetical protein
MDAFSEPDLLGRAAGPVSAELRASSLSAGAPGEDPQRSGTGPGVRPQPGDRSCISRNDRGRGGPAPAGVASLSAPAASAPRADQGQNYQN